MGRPLIDVTLDEFDEDGVQTRFAVSPFGASESREERIVRWEYRGFIDRECPGCQEKLNHPRLDAFAPSHKPSAMCRSGGQAHCTCDSCF